MRCKEHMQVFKEQTQNGNKQETIILEFMDN